jgi:hypothetical protein
MSVFCVVIVFEYEDVQLRLIEYWMISVDVVGRMTTVVN